MKKQMSPTTYWSRGGARSQILLLLPLLFVGCGGVGDGDYTCVHIPTGYIHTVSVSLGSQVGSQTGQGTQELSTAPAAAAGDQRSATWEPVSVYRKEECELPLLPFGGSFLHFCLNRVMWCWAPRNSAPLCAGWVSPRIEIKGWGVVGG